MPSKNTLSDLLAKEKISNGDVRYATDDTKAEICVLTPRCTGSIREKIFWIQHSLQDYPQCIICQSTLNGKFRLNREGGYYPLHCSVKCARRDPYVLSQQELTIKSKYGASQYLSSVDARHKIEKTNISKYGSVTPHPWGSDNFKALMHSKYGIDHVREIPDSNDRIIRNQIINNIVSGKTETSISAVQAKRNVVCTNAELAYNDSRDILEKIPLTWYHKSCGKEYSARIVDGNITVCPHCNQGASVLELSLRSIVTDLVGIDNVEFKKLGLLKNRRELDIYVKSANLAIEFNGIYWHSTLRNVRRAYHLEKTEECKSLGIKLIHIWEHKFLNNPNLIRHMLSNALGLSKSISARKCKLVELDSNTAKKFVNDNHIDGWIGGKVSLALEYEGNIVSIMVFGKRRFQKTIKKNSWEIYRYCSLAGFQIQGGASKLFTQFIKKHNPTSVVSFADKSLGGGDVYLKIGMTEKQSTPPAYFWACNLSPASLSRFQTQRHKLPKLIGAAFDPNESEDTNMRRLGWFKLWNCGNRVFEWSIQDIKGGLY